MLNRPESAVTGGPRLAEYWIVDGATFNIGAVARPVTVGEDCGDATACWVQRGLLYLGLADGLGHGAPARTAALAALDCIQQQTDAELPQLPAAFAQCDQAIQMTRGVALGVAVLNPAARHIQFCGIGNVRAVLIGQRQRRLTCGYGIVGAGFKQLMVETLPLAPGDIFIMASDGIQEQFDMPEYRLEGPWNAQRLAQAILDQWAVATDDAAVLVCQAL